MSEDKALRELSNLKGLNKQHASQLYRAGINSIEKLSRSNPDELSNLTGITKTQILPWIILARAQERKKSAKTDAIITELSKTIKIKIEDAKCLVNSGVRCVDDLANESADFLSKDTGLSPESLKKWIQKAKEVKEILAEKQKEVATPKTEGNFGSKLAGALFGSRSGFNSIYNSSSFGKSFIMVFFSALSFCLYLSMSQATLAGWSITSLWALTPLRYVFSIDTFQITLYPLVFLGGILLVLGGWLLLGKLVASAKKLAFKNTSAVLGFATTPGFFVLIVLVGKFLPSTLMSDPLRTVMLPALLIIFTLWVAIVFIRGLAFSPSDIAQDPHSIAIPKA